MKRPYANLIHAFADGAEIQHRVPGHTWIDDPYPDFDPFYEWRLKPAKKKYRVYLVKYGCFDNRPVVCNEEGAAEAESNPFFIRWLDDWKEYDDETR